MGATAAESSSLALPVQRGEETAAHVGLSYVLTCPSHSHRSGFGH